MAARCVRAGSGGHGRRNCSSFADAPSAGGAAVRPLAVALHVERAVRQLVGAMGRSGHPWFVFIHSHFFVSGRLLSAVISSSSLFFLFLSLARSLLTFVSSAARAELRRARRDTAIMVSAAYQSAEHFILDERLTQTKRP